MLLELVPNLLGTKGPAKAISLVDDFLGVQHTAHSLRPITALLGDLRAGECRDHVERPVFEPIMLGRRNGSCCERGREVRGRRPKYSLEARFVQFGGVSSGTVAKLRGG
jgi:hypothetical protein